MNSNKVPEQPCCDSWWDGLSEKEKRYVHYFFYDIALRGHLANFADSDICQMHESRFELEGYSRK